MCRVQAHPEPRLRIGDQLLWRGSWGRQVPNVARVVSIDLAGSAGGRPVESCPWFRLGDDSVAVDLDNGHWAYGYQLEPWPGELPHEPTQEELDDIFRATSS